MFTAWVKIPAIFKLQTADCELYLISYLMFNISVVRIIFFGSYRIARESASDKVCLDSEIWNRIDVEDEKKIYPYI